MGIFNVGDVVEVKDKDTATALSKTIFGFLEYGKPFRIQVIFENPREPENTCFVFNGGGYLARPFAKHLKISRHKFATGDPVSFKDGRYGKYVDAVVCGYDPKKGRYKVSDNFTRKYSKAPVQLILKTIPYES